MFEEVISLVVNVVFHVFGDTSLVVVNIVFLDDILNIVMVFLYDTLNIVMVFLDDILNIVIVFLNDILNTTKTAF